MKFRLSFLILLLLFVESIKNDQDEFAEFDSDPDDPDAVGAGNEESEVEVNNEDFGESFEDEQQQSG